jgi:hypothetical protein
MGRIIIEIPSRIKRRYKLNDAEVTQTILYNLENYALLVKENPASLTEEDKADIRAARRARKEKGFLTSEELKASLNL